MAGRATAFRLVAGSGALFAAAGLQLLFFLVSARLLKPTEFGYLSAIWAYATPTSELVGFGAADYLVQRVSRQHRAFPYMFASSLSAIALTAPIVVPLVALLAWLLPGQVSLAAIALLALSETLLARLANLSEQSMIAHGDVPYANLQRLFIAAGRLASVGAFWWLYRAAPVFAGFALFYFVGAVITTALVLTVTVRLYGPPKPRKGVGAQVRTSFALHNLGRAVSQTLDRISLSLVLPFAALGVYSAGSRVLQVGTIPVLALFRDTYAGFFRAGRGGVAGSLAYGRSLIQRALAVSIASTLCAMLFAALMPLLLGPHYAGARIVGLIVALSTVPIALQYWAGDVLTGANRQHLRTRVSLLSLLFIAPVTIAGAWTWGVIGAAAGAVIGQAGGAAAMAFAVWRELPVERGMRA